MSERQNHPSTERLHAFVEGSLEGGVQDAVNSHVVECPKCRGEVAELRSLFGALSSLPAFAPAAGFTDRVMEGVRVRRPAFAGAGAWWERVTPQTTRGWAAAAALLALPLLGGTLFVTWLMSQPGVTAQGLWTLTTGLVGEALSTTGQWAWAHFTGTSLAAWLGTALELAGSVGRGEMGLAAVVFATLTLGSIYVLYENLFRTEGRRTEHASYVF